jgi:hypothetical protein
VYDVLRFLKPYPSTSFSDIIKGLSDQVCPGEFFDTDNIDRELFKETSGLVDYSKGEYRERRKKMR